MKNKLTTFFWSLIISISTFMICSPADAYTYYYRNGYGYRGGVYYHGGYNRGYYNRVYYNNAVRCRWVDGYWARGYWHPSRRVCWHY